MKNPLHSLKLNVKSSSTNLPLSMLGIDQDTRFYDSATNTRVWWFADIGNSTSTPEGLPLSENGKSGRMFCRRCRKSGKGRTLSIPVGDPLDHMSWNRWNRRLWSSVTSGQQGPRSWARRHHYWRPTLTPRSCTPSLARLSPFTSEPAPLHHST